MNEQKEKVKNFRMIALAMFFFIAFGNISLKAEGSNPAVSESNIENQSGHEVKGVVVDDMNEPLIGVSVLEVGTQNATITNLDGEYVLKVKSPDATIRFSYIGHGTVDEAVKGRTVINLTMASTDLGIDEVVVVAYGTQRKSTVSGSLTTVKADKMVATAPTVQDMLQGQVAGMNVSMKSGKPGSSESQITIRGKGSISSTTTPLWVIDGVIGSSASLNPNDIETLTVLKDGSATALYGSQGANGAILVTTKKAYLGENRIDVSIKAGVSTLSRGNFKMMNSSQLYDYTEQALNNTFKPEDVPYNWFTPALKDNDTNWWDIATQTALTTNYNVAYRTGTDKVRSYLSADYYNEEGTVKGREYERFTVRNNMTYKFNDRLNINYSFSGNYSNTTDNQYSLGSANTYLPWDTPYNSFGEVKTGKEGQAIETGKPMSDYWFGRDASNYLYDRPMNWSKGKSVGVDLMGGFDYTIIDGLVFKSTNNFGYSESTTESYTDPKSQGGKADGGSIYNYRSENQKRYTNQQLTYNRTFNRVHEVSAFLGYEYKDSRTKVHSLTGKSIPSGGDVIGTAAEMKEMTGDEYEPYKALAYYFNGNYTFDNKYFGQISARRDGSSQFGKDNRYGNFWSIGGGWNIHNEEFLQAEFIDQLRLRASFGKTGNTPGGAFSHLNLYDYNREYDNKVGAFPNQMANRNMTWETSHSTNLGLDVRLFDRLGFTFEYYIKNVNGLLYQAKLSTLSGYSGAWRNEGRLNNSGIEFTLSPEIIKTRDWNWTVDFNFAYNKNEIKELAEGKTQELADGNTIREVGYPIGTYYLKEWGGVDRMTGNPLWIYLDDENNTNYVRTEAEANTRNLNKKSTPDITGGVQTRLTYKDFTLTASFMYAAGFYIYHYGRQYYDNDGAEIQYNSMLLKDGWSRWENPGDIATHPKPMVGGNKGAHSKSSRYLERGDYFKMKTLGISYNIPKTVLNSLKLRSATLGFSADNLFTITEFSGTDPELATSGSTYDTSAYPVPRKYMFSLTLGF